MTELLNSVRIPFWKCPTLHDKFTGSGKTTHRQSYRRTYVTLHHICDKRVKHSEGYISFIRGHAEQFHRGIPLSKFILGRNRTKSVVINSEYGWPMIQ